MGLVLNVDTTIRPMLRRQGQALTVDRRLRGG